MPPNHSLCAQHLFAHNPVEHRGITWGPFDYGGLSTSGPNCYSYAVGHPFTRLVPGELARWRGDHRVIDNGNNPEEQLNRFRQDGLIDLPEALLHAFPNNAWIVSLHQRDDGDFHLRRLDADGWSEKRGDHTVGAFVPGRWEDLLSAADDDGGSYAFAGFFVASSFLTLARPPAR